MEIIPTKDNLSGAGQKASSVHGAEATVVAVSLMLSKVLKRLVGHIDGVHHEFWLQTHSLSPPLLASIFLILL